MRNIVSGLIRPAVAEANLRSTFSAGCDRFKNAVFALCQGEPFGSP
jgi:hypothetical protein